MNKTRHIGHSITFALIIGATPIRAAIVSVDAINSEYYPSDRESSGSFSKIITGPVGAEIVNSTEVDISGNIDADTTTDPVVRDKDKYTDARTQNQGLCDTEINPKQSDSLREDGILEDSVLIEICDSLKRENIENSYRKKLQYAPSFRAAFAEEQIVNHHTHRSSHNHGSEISINDENENINKLGFGYYGSTEGSGMAIVATVLVPAIILMCVIGSYELFSGRGRKSK